MARFSKRTLAVGRVEFPEDSSQAQERPRTRADCVDGPRPCPYAGCRHHMFLDVSGAGSIKFNFPDLELEQMSETCSLDVADRGPQPLAEVGNMMNITRERVRQVEARALRNPRVRALLREYVDFEIDPLMAGRHQCREDLVSSNDEEVANENASENGSEGDDG